ncbi:MAG: VOC family protein [Acidobacteriota bacterium]
MRVSMDHIVLNVNDIDKAIHFYTEILGFEVERVNEYKEGRAPFPSIRINANTVIDLFPPNRWKKIDDLKGYFPNLNHFCLAVEFDDWQMLLKRLQMYNIPIHRESDKNWGAKGEGISFYINDTEGNEIEVRYYE